MIKLIVTDMDGTLLDGEGNLPERFFEVLDKLIERKIKFVIASGRSYDSLKSIFKPALDKLDFICDNGAFVVEDKEISSIDILDKDKLNSIIKKCMEINNIGLSLCGKKGTYQNICGDDFDKERSKYYKKAIFKEDLLNIEDEIFKIAVCDLSDAHDNSYKVLKPSFGSEFNVSVSGKVWLDIMNKNINKGAALEKIQKDLGISHNETMVFGDFYNDIEMLKKAKYSFVMENANKDMKEYGNYTAHKNTEDGVIRAIEEYVLNK